MPDEFVHGILQTDSQNVYPQMELTTATVAGLVGSATDRAEADLSVGVTPLAFNKPVVVQRPSDLDKLGITDDSWLMKGIAVCWGIAKRYFPIVVVRSEGGHTTGSGETTHTYTAQEDLLTAIDALKGAEAATNYKPDVVTCEGSHVLTVARRLCTVGTVLRAEAYVSGPDTYTGEAPGATEKTGKDAAKQFTTDLATSRAFVSWPSWKVDIAAELFASGNTIESSLLAVGLTVKTDTTEGAHVSPSNHVLDFSLFSATLVPKVAVPFDMSPSSLANELNAAHVATWVYKSGWRLWGNRTAALVPGTTNEQLVDAQYTFLSFRRVKDHYEERIDEVCLAAVDRGITHNLGQYVCGVINAEIRNDQGLLGGNCSFVRLENPNDRLKIGRVKFTCKITPVYTAECIEIEHEITDAYLSKIFGD